MTRVTIDMPGQFHFRTELPVLISHINRGNHVGNDALTGLLNEARGRFMQERGVREYSPEDGRLFINSDLTMVFRSEARHGDTLVVEVAAVAPNKYGCAMVYRVTERDSSRLVAEARSGHLLFDPASGRPVPVPEEFLTRLLG